MPASPYDQGRSTGLRMTKVADYDCEFNPDNPLTELGYAERY